MTGEPPPRARDMRVIPLAGAPLAAPTWGRPFWVLLAWQAISILIVSNPLQPSSALRRFALRAFGARIGRNVIMRPRIRIRFPWNLEVGDDCWIGEGVWISNRSEVILGSNVVLSQECFITTGSHRLRRDMATISRAVTVQDGAWITSRAIVLGGSLIRTSVVVTPGSVAPRQTEAGGIYAGNPAQLVDWRFPEATPGD